MIQKSEMRAEAHMRKYRTRKYPDWARKARFIAAVLFFVLLAYNFNPFPMDREIYSLLSSGPSFIRKLGYVALVLFYVVAAGFAASDRPLGETRFFSDLKLAVPLIVFLTYAMVACLWSPVTGTALYDMISACAIIATLFILTLPQRTPSDSVRFLYIVLFICVFTSIAGVMLIPARSIHLSAFDNGVVELSLDENLTGAWRGGFFHKNYGAGFLMLGLAIAFSAPIRRMKNPLFALYIVATMIFLYNSRSSTAMGAPIIGVFISLLAYFLSRSIPISVISTSTVCLFAAIPFLVVYLLAPEFDLDFDGRLPIWTANIDLWMTQPIFGGGTQAVYSGLGGLDRFTTQQYVARVGSHSHNGFMEVLGQLGLLGMVLILTFLGVTLYRAILLCRTTRRTEQFSASLALLMFYITALVRACMEPDFLNKRLHWFVIVYLFFAISRGLREYTESGHFVPFRRVDKLP